MIFWSIWGFFKVSVVMLLNVVFDGVDVDGIRKYFGGMLGVLGVYDFYIWLMSIFEMVMMVYFVMFGGSLGD